MHEPATSNILNEGIDILGEQPSFLNLYTQICLCFSVTDGTSHSVIINTLINGLERLSASFPWVAGKVINEDSGEGNTRTFKIRALQKTPRLVVKDLTHDPLIPTMHALKQARFPFSMLDETIIAPCKTFSGSSEGSAAESAPVFLLQATFIIGGLLLTFVGQHNTMDMTGQGQVIDLFSKACHNEQFTTEELLWGNITRSNLIPLLDDTYQRGSELDYQIVEPAPSRRLPTGSNEPPAPSPLPKSSWAYFSFHPTALKVLKSLAAKAITLSLGYISTDDVLSAFIWQSIIRVRFPRLSLTVKSTLARAVDVRRYLNISPMYQGLMQNMTYNTYTLRKLVEEPLGAVALQLRSAVDPETSKLGYNTRALATFLNRTPNKSIVSFTATLNLSTDIMLSSWAKVDCYDLDFNLGLGKPDAVRRPQFDPVESLIYLMPRRLDGEIAVGIWLRDDDMERLRADEEFVKYAEYIG